MGKFRKHHKTILPFKIPTTKEKLSSYSGNVPLNKSLLDRISFSVLRNPENKIRIIENISYEIFIDGKWEWVVRYDDHGGEGILHRHYRISLNQSGSILSSAGIKRYKDKDREKTYQRTWVFKEIKRNYLVYRGKFLKKCKLDLY